jgi:hypothetical protein
MGPAGGDEEPLRAGSARPDQVSAKSSVELVGPYEPLESGFNYEKLGVVPKPPAAYR